MQDNKTFASLTPTLLARKGGARPAMRPQIQPLHAFHENAARDWQDDLGWNDMGAPADNDGGDVQPVTGEVVAFDPALAAQARAARPARPEVLRQQEAIAERIAPAPAIQHTPAGESATVRRSALADGRRAAFTLRLDSERHLHLRLACTVANRSAQQIVTEALDRLIADMPDIADLAAAVRKRH